VVMEPAGAGPKRVRFNQPAIFCTEQDSGA